MVNKYKKILMLVIVSIIFFYAMLPPSLGEITLGDSTFPLEKDESITWKTVNATEQYYEDIEFVRFTATDVCNKSVNGNRYMFVNYTLEFYHNFAWIPKTLEDVNAFYLSYNYSLNYLNWSKVVYKEAYLLIVPIPLNLTLISNAIMREPFLNTTILGNTIVLSYFNATEIKITFNSEGISTIIEKKTNRTTDFRWELVIDDVIIILPLGTYYIWYIIIGIVFIVSIEVKRIKKIS